MSKAGQPPKFKNPKDLEKKIEEYFKNPDYKTVVTKTGDLVEIPCFTITGLAYFLGFESRQSFYDYEKHDKFSYIIKRARLKIECEYEKGLNDSNCTGRIFALKNMGWSDKQEIISTNANINIKDEKVINNVVDKLKCL